MWKVAKVPGRKEAARRASGPTAGVHEYRSEQRALKKDTHNTHGFALLATLLCCVVECVAVHAANHAGKTISRAAVVNFEKANHDFVDIFSSILGERFEPHVGYDECPSDKTARCVRFGAKAKFRTATGFVFQSAKKPSYLFTLTTELQLTDPLENDNQPPKRGCLLIVRGFPRQSKLSMPASDSYSGVHAAKSLDAADVPIQFGVWFGPADSSQEVRNVTLAFPLQKTGQLTFPLNNKLLMYKEVVFALPLLKWRWHKLTFSVTQNTEKPGLLVNAYVNCTLEDTKELKADIDTKEAMPLDMLDGLYLAWSGDQNEPDNLPVVLKSLQMSWQPGAVSQVCDSGPPVDDEDVEKRESDTNSSGSGDHTSGDGSPPPSRRKCRKQMRQPEREHHDGKLADWPQHTRHGDPGGQPPKHHMSYASPQDTSNQGQRESLSRSVSVPRETIVEILYSTVRRLDIPDKKKELLLDLIRKTCNCSQASQYAAPRQESAQGVFINQEAEENECSGEEVEDPNTQQVETTGTDLLGKEPADTNMPDQLENDREPADTNKPHQPENDKEPAKDKESNLPTMLTSGSPEHPTEKVSALPNSHKSQARPANPSPASNTPGSDSHYASNLYGNAQPVKFVSSVDDLLGVTSFGTLVYVNETKELLLSMGSEWMVLPMVPRGSLRVSSKADLLKPSKVEYRFVKEGGFVGDTQIGLQSQIQQNAQDLTSRPTEQTGEMHQPSATVPIQLVEEKKLATRSSSVHSESAKINFALPQPTSHKQESALNTGANQATPRTATTRVHETVQGTERHGDVMQNVHQAGFLTTEQSTYQPTGATPPLKVGQSGVCGDGVRDHGEECDDGNELASDACIDCKIATCGDGFRHSKHELCDTHDLGGHSCESLMGNGAQGQLKCSSTCRFLTDGCQPAGIRLVALTSIHTGYLVGGHMVHRRCSRAADRHGLKGLFQAFLASKRRPLLELVLREHWTLPVVNIKGQKLFPSWASMFQRDRPVWPEDVPLLTFDGKSLIQQHMPLSAWIGASTDGTTSTIRCREWMSQSVHDQGLAMSIKVGAPALQVTNANCARKLSVLCVLSTN